MTQYNLTYRVPIAKFDIRDFVADAAVFPFGRNNEQTHVNVTLTVTSILGGYVVDSEGNEWELGESIEDDNFYSLERVTA